ncbi:MAG: hypothetical protein K0S93_2224 [Nitrososphaeraceae archaeon]|nr:hypothetical protein [Nitrososphaeraceae archaeon]
MQQLETNKQIVEEEQKYKRMGKGRVIAQSRKVYRLVNIDVFYVESESSNDSYYVVKFKPDVFLESWYCSCKDNSIREMKCKHIFAIEFAIQWGTIKGIDGGLPTEAKVRKKVATVSPTTVTVPTTKSSYKDDEYSF